MFELFKRFLEEEEGQDLVEYALLLVFIALIVMQLSQIWEKRSATFSPMPQACCSPVRTSSRPDVTWISCLDADNGGMRDMKFRIIVTLLCARLLLSQFPGLLKTYRSASRSKSVEAASLGSPAELTENSSFGS